MYHRNPLRRIKCTTILCHIIWMMNMLMTDTAHMTVLTVSTAPGMEEAMAAGFIPVIAGASGHAEGFGK